MAVNDSLVVTGRLSSIKAIEDALDFMPENPLRDPFAGVWMYMTNNFTKFQIATFGSFIVHEVCITAPLCSICMHIFFTFVVLHSLFGILLCFISATGLDVPVCSSLTPCRGNTPSTLKRLCIYLDIKCQLLQMDLCDRLHHLHHAVHRDKRSMQ